MGIVYGRMSLIESSPVSAEHKNCNPSKAKREIRPNVGARPVVADHGDASDAYPNRRVTRQLSRSLASQEGPRRSARLRSLSASASGLRNEVISNNSRSSLRRSPRLAQSRPEASGTERSANRPPVRRNHQTGSRRRSIRLASRRSI